MSAHPLQPAGPPPVGTPTTGGARDVLADAVVIIGGGGHALVVAEAAMMSGLRIAGFLDDNPAAPLGAILIDHPHPFPAPPHLGPIRQLSDLAQKHLVIGLGDLRTRRAVIRSMSAPAPQGPPAAVRACPVTVVHPRASVSPSAMMGPGVFVGPMAVVHSRARIGAHAIINSGAIVEHDCVIEENAHIGPGAVLAGSARVGTDTLVGAGARVLPGVAIGAHCTVAAGAVVTRNVPDGRTVKGVPAR
jgi:acetyltransferase EpsM